MDGFVSAENIVQGVQPGDSRLFERIPMDGALAIRSGKAIRKYKIYDVSVGGLRLAVGPRGQAENDVITGKLTLNSNGLEISSEVTCKVVTLDGQGLSAKFIDISEEMVEFLRAAVQQYKLKTGGGAATTTWLPSTAEYRRVGSVGFAKKSWFSNYVFRFEWVLVALILGLGAIVLARAGDDQTFWLVKNHELNHGAQARIVSLNTDFPVAAGQPIAVVASVNGEAGDENLEITAPVSAESVTWRFNVDDLISPSDVLGILHGIPSSDGQVQVVVGAENPFFTVAVGDRLIFRSADGHRVEGRVVRSVTKSQAAAITGLLSTSLPFDAYHLVDIPLASGVQLENKLQLNHFATLMDRLGNWANVFTSSQ